MNDTALLTAVAITEGLACVVTLVLHWPLRRMLAKFANDFDMALFWALFCDVLLLLIPGAVALMFAETVPPHLPFVVLVSQYVKWGAIGLIAALFTVAGTAAFLVKPLASSFHVTADQMDGMQRLLAKVDQIRAREIVRRLPDPSDQ